MSVFMSIFSILKVVCFNYIESKRLVVAENLGQYSLQCTEILNIC